MQQIWRLQNKNNTIGNEWFVAVGHIGIALGVNLDTEIFYLSSISFQEKKLVLISLMMAPYCSLQYVEPAESY